MKAQIYAIFKHPDWGMDGDIQSVKEAELVLDLPYQVAEIDMGQSFTYIRLVGSQRWFNSVHFDFEEKGEPINIYNDPRFNPYMRSGQL